MKLFKKKHSYGWRKDLNPARLGIIDDIAVPEEADDLVLAGSPDAPHDAVSASSGDGVVAAGELETATEHASQQLIYLGGARNKVAAQGDTQAAGIPAPDLPRVEARVIVVANEKGGCGKSTVAMHVALYLMEQGNSVGTIDLDARQGTLSRMFENREAFAAANALELPMPSHVSVPRSQADSQDACRREEHKALRGALEGMAEADFIVIDTPGSDIYLSRLAHQLADTLITPVNDSFVDLDVLAHIDATEGSYQGPSAYSRMVLAERQRRQEEERAGFDWIVMRNRLSNLYARNKQDMAEAMDALAQDLDFRMAPGFGERVIFRELFSKGLTLLDLRRREIGIEWTMSHVGARQELRQLVEAAGLDDVRGEDMPATDVIAAQSAAELPKQCATAA